MNLVDVLVLLVVAGSVFHGTLRGFVMQAIVVCSIVAGAVVAFWVFGASQAWWGRGGAFTLLALRCLVAVTAGVLVLGLLQVLADRVGRRTNESIVGPLNRAAGLVLGLGWGVALAALALLLTVSVPLPRPVHRAVYASWSAPRLFELGEDVTRRGRPLPGARWLAGRFHAAAARGRDATAAREGDERT